MALILSFDISSISTGFSVIIDGKFSPDAYGTIKPNSKLSYGARLLFFENEIVKIIKKFKPDIVAIEEIFKGLNILTFKSLSMFRGVAIKAIYEQIGKDPVSIAAVEARSTLNLSSSKEDAFKEAIKQYNLKQFNFEDDNDIVDSIILGLAIYNLLQQGINEKSLQGFGRRKKRKSKGNKKRISKVSNGVSSRSKPRKQKGRRKI